MFTSTGTTIVGLKFRNGILLCADSRSTNGDIVADKYCNKIHYIADNIFCCGSGTAGDVDRVTMLAAKQLSIYSKKYNRIAKAAYAERLMSQELFYYQGHKQAGLILGGIDDDGLFLSTIYPHGSSARNIFNASGSGSLAAMGILEAYYKPDMEIEEAVSLGVEAIKAGILNDLYSGTQVNIKIIMQDEAKIFTTEDRAYPISKRCDSQEKKFKYPLDSIKITREEIIKMLSDGE